MFLKCTYRALVAFMVTLFLFMQVLTVAHATTYGEIPHDHDGIECAIDAVAQDDEELLPRETVINLPILHTHAAFTPAFVSISYLAPQGRAPPPRGPPQ